MWNESQTCSEAKSSCHANDGKLLEIYTSPELEYLMKGIGFANTITNHSFWTGASDHQQSGQFLWNSTGIVLINSNWATGFPSKTSSAITCTMILIVDCYPWINADCFEKSHFMCETMLWTPSSTQPNEILETNETNIFSKVMGKHKLYPWATGAYSGTSKFVAIETDLRLSWEGARSLCQQYDMDLVYIDSEAKWKFLREQLRENDDFTTNWTDYARIWLGGVRPSYAISQYTVVWTNGKEEDLEHHIWEIAEEKRYQKCLTMYTEKRLAKMLLNLISCNETSFISHVVCESSDLKHKCQQKNDCMQYKSSMHK